MIILDLQQVMISNLMVQIGNHTNAELEETMLRHMILNSIRAINKKYKTEYGELVIACDSTSWRKEAFAYYKANRRQHQAESEMKWQDIFAFMHNIRQELKENFPYRVISVNRAEADDIIGVLANEFGTQLNMGRPNNKILIVSGDKDFIQLQVHANVVQYDPVRKRTISHPNPNAYKREHIIRGDKGDGIPNFLAPDNALVMKIKQPPITKNKLKVWLTTNPEEFCTTPTMLERYRRNEKLIDLNFTPADIKQQILEDFASQANKPRSKLFSYFIQHKLKLLVEGINDF